MNEPRITEEMISVLVDRFYARVRSDAIIGPVFAERISGWPPHLERMKAFWSSVMLTSGRYKGRPAVVHAMVPGIRPWMFARWLALFESTLNDLFEPDIAAAFMLRANRMSESLQAALFRRSGPPLKPVAGNPQIGALR